LDVEISAAGEERDQLPLREIDQRLQHRWRQLRGRLNWLVLAPATDPRSHRERV
jgi:hypothetical protein